MLALQPSSSKTPENEWEVFKELLRDLYVEQDKSVKDIRNYMLEAYAFERSRQQYERKFAKWAFKKNYSRKEWQNVNLQLKRRHLEIDDAEVVLDGRTICTKRLKKAISRHTTSTLSGKWLANSTNYSAVNERIDGTIATPATSSAIIVRPLLRPEFRILPATDLPLFEFWDLVSTHFFLPSIHQSDERTMRRMELDMSRVDQVACQLAKRIGQLHTSTTNNAPSRDLAATQNKQLSSSLVHIQQFIYLMSNNLVGVALRELSDDPAGMKVLGALLLNTVPCASHTSKAVIAWLFRTAIDRKNLNWIQQLQNMGFDMNTIVNNAHIFDDTPTRTTVLQAFAYSLRNKPISSENIKLLRALLSGGADPNLCGRYHGLRRVDTSKQVCNTVKCSKGYSCCAGLPLAVMLHSVSHGALSSEIFTALWEAGAHVCERLDLTALIQGEVDESILKDLFYQGIVTSNHPYKGPKVLSRYYNPLQAAVATRTTGLATLLLELGAIPRCIPVGSIELSLSEKRPFESQNMEPRSPLTLALLTDHDLAKQLLAKGAPTNECYFDRRNLPSAVRPEFYASFFNFEDFDHTSEQILEAAFGVELVVRFQRPVRGRLIDYYKVHNTAHVPQRTQGLRSCSANAMSATGALSPVQAAVASTSTEIVKAVMYAGGSVQCCHGTPPLVIAVRSQQIEMVQLLLELGADVNQAMLDLDPRPWLLSPVAEAAVRGDLAIMSLLIDAGADIDYCNQERGLTALQAAIVCKAKNSVHFLLKHCKPDLLHQSSDNGLDAFTAAIFTGNSEIFDHLSCATYSENIPSTIFRDILSLAITSEDKRFMATLQARGLAIYASDVIESCVASEATFQWLQSAGFDLNKTIAGRRISDEAFKYALSVDGFEDLCDGQRLKVAWSILEQGEPVSSEVSKKLLSCFAMNGMQWISEAEEDSAIIESAISLCCASRNWILTYEECEWLVPFILNFSTEFCQSLVNCLIHVGFDLNRYCHAPSRNTFLTPLQAVAAVGNLCMVDILLQHGAQVNSPVRKPSTPGVELPTPLQISAADGNLPIVRKLIDHGADVNIASETSLVIILRDEECNTWWTGDKWSTPLGHVINLEESKDSHDLVDLLLKSGAYVNAQAAWNGRTATQIGAARSDTTIVQRLIAWGADVNAVASSDCSNSTALQTACGGRDLEMVRVLLDNGADVNAAAPLHYGGRTALQSACINSDLELVKILLSHGADINAPAGADHGATALQYAAIEGHFQIAQILLGAGADVAAPASAVEGRTAIDGAAEHGRLDMVKFLLDHYNGDEPVSTVCDNALAYAQCEGHMAVVELLQTYLPPLHAEI